MWQLTDEPFPELSGKLRQLDQQFISSYGELDQDWGWNGVRDGDGSENIDMDDDKGYDL